MSIVPSQPTMTPANQSAQGRLTNKIALITGASQGIGAAIARLFAREGASVVLAACNLDELNTLAAEIQTNGGTALAVPTDVTDAASIPLGRVAEAADVAEATLWPCSDAAAYLTGVTLPVDGGFTVA